MLRSDPVRQVPGANDSGGFVLYIEGPSDRDILRAWASRQSASFSRALVAAAVILGGRQPARAAEHFRSHGGAEAGLRGVCVLDRDGGDALPARGVEEPGLEFFTWGRRHIESYLLVPDAIRRGLRLPRGDTLVERLLREHLPADGDENAFQQLDAKRLFGRASPLVRALGRPIPVGRVARVMREEEIHADIHALLDRVRRGLGEPERPEFRRRGGFSFTAPEGYPKRRG